MTDAPLGLTPSQTVGPYLSIGLLRDLVTPHVVERSHPGAIVLTGLVLDGAGEPVPDGTVEAWQADAAGRYVDQELRGFARSGTADGGRYELVILKPGPVPWPEGGMQAPHLLLGVFARGLLKRLATRMYFPDEVQANGADPVLSRLEESRRASLVAQPDGDGLRFDIVLQGPGETTFFAV